MQRTKCHSIPVAASPLVNSILSVLFWIFDIDSGDGESIFFNRKFLFDLSPSKLLNPSTIAELNLFFLQLVHIWMLDCFHQVLHPLLPRCHLQRYGLTRFEEIDKAEQVRCTLAFLRGPDSPLLDRNMSKPRFDISKLMTVEKEVKNLEAKDTLALGKPLETSPV